MRRRRGGEKASLRKGSDSTKIIRIPEHMSTNAVLGTLTFVKVENFFSSWSGIFFRFDA